MTVGPVLHVLYTAELRYALAHQLPHGWQLHQYADNSQVYISVPLAVNKFHRHPLFTVVFTLTTNEWKVGHRLCSAQVQSAACANCPIIVAVWLRSSGQVLVRWFTLCPFYAFSTLDILPALTNLDRNVFRTRLLYKPAAPMNLQLSPARLGSE